MTSTTVALVVAVGVIVLVLFWSGRYGGRNRYGTTSLRRGPSAHTTRTGRAKVGYASREEALTHAQSLARRDGASMSVYRCPTCKQWHVGHQR